MRIIAIVLLTLFLGPMLVGIAALIGHEVAENIFVILTIGYIAFSVIFLPCVLFHYWSLTQDVRARSMGGWIYVVTQTLNEHSDPFKYRVVRKISLVLGFMADIIAWPAIVIANAVRKYFVRQPLIKNDSWPSSATKQLINSIALYDLSTQLFQTVTMFLVTLGYFVICVLIGDSRDDTSTLFIVFLMYANLVLLVFALAPRNLVMRLKQQPYHPPKIVLMFLIITIGGILILGYTGFTLGGTAFSLDVFLQTLYSFINVYNVFDIIEKQAWSSFDVAITFSSVMFSIVLIQAVTQNFKNLKRTDNDWIIIASKFFQFGNVHQAADSLSNIESVSPSTEQLYLEAGIHSARGQITLSSNLMSTIIFSLSRDFPKPLSDGDVDLYRMKLLLFIPGMINYPPQEQIENFFKRNQSPEALLEICDSAILSGVYKSEQLLRMVDNQPITESKLLARVYLLLCLKQYVEAQRLFSTLDYKIVETNYRASNLILIYFIEALILFSTAKYASNKKDLESWCNQRLSEINILLDKMVSSKETPPAMFINGFSWIICKLLRKFSTQYAANLEQSTGKLRSILEVSRYGRLALQKQSLMMRAISQIDMRT